MKEMLLRLGLNEDDIDATQIFMKHTWARSEKLFKSNRRFVHYTSADTAIKIFRTSQVWARNATCMNDFAELDYGFNCLKKTLTKHGDLFESTFDTIFPGFKKKLIEKFDDWLPHFRSETYITCLSEHLAEENELGRLSMWRAYGGSSGVALVVNPLPLLSPSDALGAYASPVAYLSLEEFEEKFLELLKDVSANGELIQRLGETACHSFMFEAFRFALVCTKHPGFHEEREWRAVHSRTFNRTDRIKMDVETVGGIPQKVCKIPLEDYPDEGLFGITIDKFLSRVIVGPSEYPDEVRSALVDVLDRLGVPEASTKVVISDIPLRT
ncbi:DUF2971 domain-containing protein [Roseibium album]|uniref:DUF2971 domain-containing protein n=1 Tax=Roseibium album TaxID=311410 RepID=UPI0032985E2B